MKLGIEESKLSSLTPYEYEANSKPENIDEGQV